MSTLGKQAIVDRMIKGDLSVTPLLSDSQIGTASVDLRMGNIVMMVRARGTSHVSPHLAKKAASESEHAKELHFQQKLERHELPFRSPFLLHPGALALVPTLEWVVIPGDLIGAVTARSTWAREGLSIATATLIEPGYKGIVTLELANLGEIPIALYPGLQIAQISFTKVTGGAPRVDRGQFRLSFEPRQGKVAKESEFPFLPD